MENISFSVSKQIQNGIIYTRNPCFDTFQYFHRRIIYHYMLVLGKFIICILIIDRLFFSKYIFQKYYTHEKKASSRCFMAYSNFLQMIL